MQQQVARLERLLGDRRELMKYLKKELRDHKKRHSDQRRTRLAWELLENQQVINVTPSDDPEPPKETSKRAKSKKTEGEIQIQQTLETGNVTEEISEKTSDRKSTKSSNNKRPNLVEVPLISLTTELNIPIAEPQDITVQITHNVYIRGF